MKKINKYLHYPETIDIFDFIENDIKLTENQKRLSKKYYQRILYPITLLINKKHSNSEKEYFRINQIVLQPILTQDFYFVLTFLQRCEIIVRSEEGYIVGERSLEYRINEKYNKDQIKNKLITDKTLLKNLTDEEMKVYNHRKIRNNIEKLRIDRPKVIEYLKDEFCPDLEYTKTDYSNENIYSYVKEMIGHENTEDKKINDYINRINRFFNMDYYISQNHTNYRIDTNLTGLPRGIRKTLYIIKNKQKIYLKEMDIANSQPLLFTKFLKDRYNLEDYIFENPVQDVIEFINLCEQGLIYDYLMDKWQVKTSRETFKKTFFKKCFYFNHLDRSGQIKPNINGYRNKFEIEFPNVYKLIIEMKERNYKDFPILLQKLESEIFITHISNRLHKENIFFNTIHDGLLINPNDKDYIESVILEVFKKYDLFPNIKIK